MKPNRVLPVFCSLLIGAIVSISTTRVVAQSEGETPPGVIFPKADGTPGDQRVEYEKGQPEVAAPGIETEIITEEEIEWAEPARDTTTVAILAAAFPGTWGALAVAWAASEVIEEVLPSKRIVRRTLLKQVVGNWAFEIAKSSCGEVITISKGEEKTLGFVLKAGIEIAPASLGAEFQGSKTWTSAVSRTIRSRPCYEKQFLLQYRGARMRKYKETIFIEPPFGDRYLESEPREFWVLNTAGDPVVGSIEVHIPDQCVGCDHSTCNPGETNCLRNRAVDPDRAVDRGHNVHDAVRNAIGDIPLGPRMSDVIVSHRPDGGGAGIDPQASNGAISKVVHLGNYFSSQGRGPGFPGKLRDFTMAQRALLQFHIEAGSSENSEVYIVDTDGTIQRFNFDEEKLLSSGYRIVFGYHPSVVVMSGRGDVDGDEAVTMTDATLILGHLFNGEDGPPCQAAADANSDGRIDMSDATYILSFLFLGGEVPAAPFGVCGVDPADRSLGCEEPNCP